MTQIYMALLLWVCCPYGRILFSCFAVHFQRIPSCKDRFQDNEPPLSMPGVARVGRRTDEAGRRGALTAAADRLVWMPRGSTGTARAGVSMANGVSVGVSLATRDDDIADAPEIDTVEPRVRRPITFKRSGLTRTVSTPLSGR